GAPPEVNSRDFGGRKGRDFADIRALPDGDVFTELRKQILAHVNDAKKILIAAYSEGTLARIKGLMVGAGCANVVECGSHDAVKALKTGQTGLCVLALEHGFVAPDLAVFSEQDILGDRLARKSKK